MRKGKCINTYSKGEFWPLDPLIEEIKIVDIAHALSMLCRANGHYSHFYSVGQHSINCAYEAKNKGLSEKIQLACLLHDASEAYISDVTRPVKKLLSGYLEIEVKLQTTIYKAYKIVDLTDEERKAIDEIDDAMLSYEMKVLLDIDGVNKLQLAERYDLSFKEFKEVKKEFIDILNELLNRI